MKRGYYCNQGLPQGAKITGGKSPYKAHLWSKSTLNLKLIKQTKVQT